MLSTQPVDLGNRIKIIDCMEFGVPGRTGSYVIQEELLTIVETGASPSVPFILNGLHDLNLDPEDIRFIILTHIHLDHAGGVGLLLQSCPNAQVIAHPKGKKHLVHPERLIVGARQVYGEKFEQLFHPILPVPEDKIMTKEHGETLNIGPNRTLKFWDTPGHANHHLSIYDPVSNGIFTGDTLGMYRYPLTSQGNSFNIPITSPNQFNPESLLNSIEFIQLLNVSRIYFGHYGMSKDPSEVYSQLKYWLPIFVQTAEQAVAEGYGEEMISDRLYQHIRSYLEQQDTTNITVYETLKSDLDICAMGLVDCLKKRTWFKRSRG